MTIAVHIKRPLHRAPLALAVLGLTALGVSANAAATPTVTLKTKALPIAGFPNTGNIRGAGAVIEVEYTIAGSEYGGFPPPLTGVKYFAPAGAKLHSQGFASCQPSTLEQSGPTLCPKKSLAGPPGSARGVVSFGAERVYETLSVQPLFAPDGNLEFYLEGHTPASIEILSTGQVLKTSPPFSLEVIGQVPLIETVPGAPDASAEKINVKIGAAYKQGPSTISYVTVPKKCVDGGLLVKSQLSFLGGATAEASYKMPCPRPGLATTTRSGS
jgi:hypothetical protein